MNSTNSKNFPKEFSDSLNKNPTLKLIIRLLVLADAGIWSAVIILAMTSF
jgi:hypothetical protein